MRGPFAPLAHARFRALWFAGLVSFLGTWVHNVAARWTAATLSTSPIAVSAVDALQLAPMVLLSLFAGRLADARHNARIYGVEREITFVRGDALAVVQSRADPEAVLFLDPPWGVDWPRGGMGTADLPLLDGALGAGIERGYHTFVVKLPPSFRVGELVDGRPEAVYGLAAGDLRRVKFLLVTRRSG